MRSFAYNRPYCLRSHIMKYFNLPDTCQITLLSNPQQGNIKINSLLIDEKLPGIEEPVYPWKGVYFKGNPVILEATSKPGYRFDYWMVNGVLHEEKRLIIDPDNKLTIEAVFKYNGAEQKIIHYFHFNTIDNNLSDGIYSDYSVVSSASIQYLGTGTGYMDDVDGTIQNTKMDAPAGKALRVRNPSNTKSLVFDIPTEGFKDIVFSYAVCRTKNGATKQSLYFNTTDDDSGWTLFSSGIPVNENFETKTFDFSKIEEANDNKFFKVRLTFDENSSGTSGNNRLDNVTVIGTTIFSEDSIPPVMIKPIQNEFSMLKIYPNPIHDKAIIVISLPARSHIKMRIYDMHGRLVATPVNEIKNEGINNLVWKTEGTPTGIYICRVNVGNAQKIRKLVVKHY